MTPYIEFEETDSNKILIALDSINAVEDNNDNSHDTTMIHVGEHVFVVSETYKNVVDRIKTIVEMNNV